MDGCQAGPSQTVANGCYPPTQWSVVMGARGHSSGALNILFTSYRQPLLTYLQVQGVALSAANPLVVP